MHFFNRIYTFIQKYSSMAIINPVISFLVFLVITAITWSSCDAIDKDLVNQLRLKGRLATEALNIEVQVAAYTELKALYIAEYGCDSWKVQECSLHLNQAQKTMLLSNDDKALLRQAFKLSELAERLADEGELHLAIKAQNEALVIFHDLLGESSPTYYYDLELLTTLYNASGNIEKAIGSAGEYLVIREKHLPSMAAVSKRELAEVNLDAGRRDVAQKLFTESEAGLGVINPQSIAILSVFFNRIGLSKIFNDQNQATEAMELLQSLKQLTFPLSLTPGPTQDAFKLEEAQALWKTGRFQEARPLLSALQADFEEGKLSYDLVTRKRFVDLMVEISREQDGKTHAMWKRRQRILEQVEKMVSGAAEEVKPVSGQILPGN